MTTYQITLCDESLSGEKTNLRVLDLLTERITVRELIRERVYQEVREFNAETPDIFRGLVQPTDTEATLNGYRFRTERQRQKRRIDWEEQYRKATDAFEKNGFFILVSNRQVENLDEEIVIGPESEVSFIRLVPLVGG